MSFTQVLPLSWKRVNTILFLRCGNLENSSISGDVYRVDLFSMLELTATNPLLVVVVAKHND